MIRATSDNRVDLELLASARNGDQQAFGEIATKYYHSCRRVATSILRDSFEAEDTVQQALGKAFLHIDQYLGEADFLSWLLRIVINECRMLLRCKKRARTIYSSHMCERSESRDCVSSSIDPENEAITRDMIEVLRTEIRRMPPLLRQVVLLRDVDELPMPEIADRIGITVPAAKSRLMRGRAELRDRIANRFGHSRHGMRFRAAAIPPSRPTSAFRFPN